ncbi:uncharacterized protein LOC142323706 [Lycorma delicatula]|uniref:uncharacterized protein LOC142323706 n=1 Tax=Lycorma delicatula TaxID=130591 RepID=UPI003F519178
MEQKVNTTGSSKDISSLLSVITSTECGTQTEISYMDGLSHSKTETIIASNTESLVLESPGPSNLVQVDAVHPLFNGCRYKTRSVGTSTEEDKNDLYYCPECKTFILKENICLKMHFQRPHEPYNNCIYCKEPVYFYICGNERLFYHICHNSFNNESNLLCETSSLSEYNNNNNNNENFEKKVINK